MDTDKLYSTLYGPKPCERERSLWKFVVFIACAIICWILYWRFFSCPIKTETTKITYYHHTNSGEAVYTTVMLYPDRLVWIHDEARNGFCLKDSCRYDKEEYEKLLKDLSSIHFSTISHYDGMVGGEGYDYSFESDTECYLSYCDSYYFIGNYQKVAYIVQDFITKHKTSCQMLFEKYSKMPHERAFMGELQELPQELERYKAKNP